MIIVTLLNEKRLCWQNRFLRRFNFFDIDEIKFLSFSFRPLSKIIKQQIKTFQQILKITLKRLLTNLMIWM